MPRSTSRSYSTRRSRRVFIEGSIVEATKLTVARPRSRVNGGSSPGLPALRLLERALEARERPLHRVALDGEGDADVAGHAEAGTRHGEHALVGEHADEGL